MLKDKTLGKLLIIFLFAVPVHFVVLGYSLEYISDIFVGLFLITMLIAIFFATFFAVWVGVRLIKKHKFTTIRYKVISNKVLGNLLLLSLIIFSVFFLTVMASTLLCTTFTLNYVPGVTPTYDHLPFYLSFFCKVGSWPFFDITASASTLAVLLLVPWSAIRLIREKNI